MKVLNAMILVAFGCVGCGDNTAIHNKKDDSNVAGSPIVWANYDALRDLSQCRDITSLRFETIEHQGIGDPKSALNFYTTDNMLIQRFSSSIKNSISRTILEDNIANGTSVGIDPYIIITAITSTNKQYRIQGYLNDGYVVNSVAFSNNSRFYSASLTKLLLESGCNQRTKETIEKHQDKLSGAWLLKLE